MAAPLLGASGKGTLALMQAGVPPQLPQLHQGVWPMGRVAATAGDRPVCSADAGRQPGRAGSCPAPDAIAASALPEVGPGHLSTVSRDALHCRGPTRAALAVIRTGVPFQPLYCAELSRGRA